MSLGDSEFEEPLIDPRSLSIKELVIRLDGKMTSAVGVLTAGQLDLRESHADHETRIRVVEAKQASFVTVRALFAAVGAAVAAAGTLTGVIVTLASHVNLH
jgi:hypothetical protein